MQINIMQNIIRYLSTGYSCPNNGRTKRPESITIIEYAYSSSKLHYVATIKFVQLKID